MKRLPAFLVLAALGLPSLHAADVSPGAAAASPASAAASRQARPKPSEREAQCLALRRRYLESDACYAPFRNANGSVKVEAFDKCGPAVPEPVGECASTVNR
jgi:hypothetical protein